MGSSENVAQNRFFILDSGDFSVLDQIYANICKDNVTVGFSERSAVLLVKPLSDKRPTATQESSLAAMIISVPWLQDKARLPMPLGLGGVTD